MPILDGPDVLKIPRGEQIPLAAKRDPYTPEQPTTRSLFRYPQSGDTPQRPGKVARLPNPCESCHSAASRSLPTPKTKFVQNDRFARSIKFCCRACRSVLLHCPLGRRLLVPTLYGIWSSRSVSPSHLRKAKKVDFFGLPKKLTRVSFAVSRVRFFLLRPKKLRAIET